MAAASTIEFKLESSQIVELIESFNKTISVLNERIEVLEDLQNIKREK